MKNLRARIEDALLAHFTASITGTVLASFPIVKGQTEGDLPDECVVLYAESATPSDSTMAAHGNADAVIRIMVGSNANDTTASVHQDRVQAAREIMGDIDGLSAQFAAQSVHLYAAFLTGEEEGHEKDRFGNSLNYSAPVVDNPAP